MAGTKAQVPPLTSSTKPYNDAVCYSTLQWPEQGCDGSDVEPRAMQLPQAQMSSPGHLAEPWESCRTDYH